ncbi:hypothetical protein K438DRAFT_1953692 [Mycena galopus ATCC 62051]|nr:hypothetical protein K438DRAFT_1953692 [Mycena galopus ATCC 62051]
MSGSGVTYYQEGLKDLLRLLKNLPDTIILIGDHHNFIEYAPDGKEVDKKGCSKSIVSHDIGSSFGQHRTPAGKDIIITFKSRDPGLEQVVEVLRAHMDEPGVGILELPNEVLIQILQYDPADSGIFSLSTSCRRLHHLALPIYLAAHGVPDPPALASGDLVLFSNQLYLLRVLQTALFIHSLKHISCAFSSLNSRDHRPRRNLFLRDIGAMAGFLSNLKRVDEVTLDFTALNFWVLSQNLGALNAWESTISALLDVILEKRCTTFKPPIAIKRRSLLSDLGRRIATTFVRRTEVEQVSAAEEPKPGLRTFNIHSNILLLPPCYGWTMAALRESPNLTALSIVCIDIPERNGDDILSNIHAPGLQYFAMDLSCKVTAAALDQFLARHPCISTSSFGTRVSLPNGLVPNRRPKAR